MDSSFDVADPSDWLETTVSQLGPVEAALRCQVCKDFFNTPMITSCAHTFCSLCIRRCLTTDGACPSCRTQDQEIKLRANPIVQELVDHFQAARPKILELGKKSTRARGNKSSSISKAKRKLQHTDIEEGEDELPTRVKRHGRETISQLQSRSSSHNQAIASAVDIDEDTDQDYETGDEVTIGK